MFPTPKISYELTYDSEEGTAFVYVYRYAGICGPHTPIEPANSKTDARRHAVRWGFAIDSGWDTTNDVVYRARVTPVP